MKLINYKKHDIILDPKSYWNSKKMSGGNVHCKIYKGDNCIFEIRYLFYKKSEIIKMLKKEINERLKK
tara:strand:+ start:324 stop:527 length:204 start_codon:yes stop_codon:yes gene_type:complete